MLEEARDRKYNMYARVIQKAFKKYFAWKRQAQQKQEAADLFFGHKERRWASLNRNFVGDYIGLEGKPQTMSLIGRREKVFFAEVVKKYDRRFKVKILICQRHKRPLICGPQKSFTIISRKSNDIMHRIFLIS